MKMDIFNVMMVDLRFRLRQLSENIKADSFDLFGQRTFSDQFDNIRKPSFGRNMLVRGMRFG